MASNTWSTIEDPSTTDMADIAAYGEYLYMATANKLIRYNPVSEERTELATSPFYFSIYGALSAYEGKLYGNKGDNFKEFGVYDIEEGKWKALPEPEDGTTIGSAIDPVSGTYFTAGPSEGRNLDRYDIATEEWGRVELPFEVGFDAMTYLPLPGFTGIYVVQGNKGTHLVRYATSEQYADLSLRLMARIVSTSTGGEVTYTIQVSNGGPGEAVNVKTSDALPAGMSLLSASTTQGSCSGTSTITCELGAMAAKAEATVRVTVSAPEGTATDTATVSGEPIDLNEANNSASIPTTVTAAPEPSPSPGPTPSPEPGPAPAPALGPAPHCVVPKMHRMTLAGLRKALAAAQCALGKVGHRHNRKLAKGLVIYGSPHHGAVLAQGSRVNVWVSSGRSPECGVPRRLHGMSVKQAEKALRAADCRPGKLVRMNDRKVAKGDVIEVRPHHGHVRPAGSRIEIWVSKGRR